MLNSISAVVDKIILLSISEYNGAQISLGWRVIIYLRQFRDGLGAALLDLGNGLDAAFFNLRGGLGATVFNLSDSSNL